MKPLRVLVLIGMFSVVMWQGSRGEAQHREPPKPVLVHTCIITSKFRELVDFYQHILDSQAQISNSVYAEFPSSAGVLAIFSAEAQQQYIPGSAIPATNKSAILEFKVGNVDDEFARLQGIVKVWVKRPTNQPWGTRSFHFRDPDGNLVDFYAPTKPQ
ncbi:MAG: VOC family protein [Candidatus Sulfotelmatobacter sp.]